LARYGAHRLTIVKAANQPLAPSTEQRGRTAPISVLFQLLIKQSVAEAKRPMLPVAPATAPAPSRASPPRAIEIFARKNFSESGHICVDYMQIGEY
jgi:hypothetical protein